MSVADGNKALCHKAQARLHHAATPDTVPKTTKRPEQMFRTPEFEAYVYHASVRPQLWRISAALLSGFVIFVTLTAILLYLLVVPLYYLDELGPTDFFSRIEIVGDISLTGMETGSTPEKMAIVLIPFIALATAAFSMAVWHRRSPLSLFGRRAGFLRNLLLVGGVVFGLKGLFLLIEVSFDVNTHVQHLQLDDWLLNLAWAIPLIFVQTSSEEMVFRGYLQQQLAARFQSPIWWMLLPTVIFALGHYDSTDVPENAAMFVISAGVFGLIAADLTRITGSLAAAMGLHFANNLFPFLAVAVPDNESGLALYHTSYGLDEIQTLYAVDLVMLLAIWFISRHLLR